jgi:hypothetical protein
VRMHILVCKPAASLSCTWTTGRAHNLETGERIFSVKFRASSGRRINCISSFQKVQLKRGSRVRAAVGGDSEMKLTGSTEEMRSLQVCLNFTKHSSIATFPHFTCFVSYCTF